LNSVYGQALIRPQADAQSVTAQHWTEGVQRQRHDHCPKANAEAGENDRAPNRFVLAVPFGTGLMNERKAFWFVLLMASFVLVGAWRIAGWAGVLLAVGSVGLYITYHDTRSEKHAATIRGSSEMLQSIAQRMSDMSGALESIREDLRKEREAEKEKERRRFWRKVEVQDSGGAGPVN
jgi:hypothetical protein